MPLPITGHIGSPCALNSLFACQYVAPKHVLKRPSTPSPISQPSSPCQTTNVFSDEDDESDMVTGIVPRDCPVIINDVVGLQLGPLPRQESRWLINEIDVSEKWHQFKEKSLKSAMERGLFVLVTRSSAKTKTTLPTNGGSFRCRLMHKDMLQRFTEQETEFDFEIFTKLTQIVKQGKVTRDIAVAELQTLIIGRSYGEISILKAIKNIIERVPRTTLKGPVGEVELCTTYIDPVLSPVVADPDRDVFLRWSNKEAPESKARKLTSRARQPDAIINNIDQLSWGPSRGHGEAKVQEEANNLYNLCADLIRVAVFNKDGIDFYNVQCMLGFQVVGQHISFYLTTLLYDGLYVMTEIGHQCHSNSFLLSSPALTRFSSSPMHTGLIVSSPMPPLK
ncbi:hypothetical protein BC938DRAFT_476785 [Jimgerdemannia flammicorona]|uniref:Uncharacterized protein n=1 Tax=Jimgerdemannia flammicorona TaxID=994334 RepID=A0A433QQ43_9FUNG|nr:hypothetical protein BC938DRAFT_476785 [Jimgerdemannia flammicorona]